MKLPSHVGIIALAASGAASSAFAQGSKKDELFRDVEVRVIRQKYFQKTMRLEIAGNLNAVMNKSFIYTMMGSGQLGFHISETIGLYGEGGAGFTMNKGDCDLLGDKFRIEPIVDDLKHWYGGGVNYTPVYGKYQMSSGDVQYFDWFFTAGAGMAGTNKRMGTCIPSSAEESQAYSMLALTGGTGQRFFLNKDAAFVWQIRYMLVQDPLGGNIFNGISNVLFSLGMSYFL